MRRTVTKILLAVGFLAAVAVGAVVSATELRWRRTFDARYPPIAISADPAMVEHGRYLVYGPAACAYCHVPKEQWTRLDAGIQLPLSGNHVFRLPFGEIYSSNLTPDVETGIGRRTDAELGQILRYGIRADRRAAFPLMEYHDVSDQDLAAILSFLRRQPAVRNAVPEHNLSLRGKALMASVIEPTGPVSTPMRISPAAVASVARGEYLANSVSSCASCHTDRDPRSGALVGPRFAGGQRMDVAADATKVFVPPNLTPDSRTSPIGDWTADQFVTRLRQGEW